jgi:methylmalonyl-CoA mutase, C-terminal domain
MEEKPKVLIAKLGLDIHWRGAVMVSRFLRDAGMEVVYMGNAFPEDIVDAALQEGAHVVGLSTLCGNHLTLGPKVVELLRDRGASDVAVFIGGTIPPEDQPRLRTAGVAEVFPPESPLDHIIACVHRHSGIPPSCAT